MCTIRLGFNLGEHRLLEVFSKCKKSVKSDKSNAKGLEHELTVEEFNQALDYLQQKVATVSLSLLGRSWGWLMVRLAYLCLILVLWFLFLILAMSAFIPGGTFGAIVNSILTIVAGLGLAKKEREDNSSGEDQKKLSTVVEEIQDMVMNDQ
eukprot:CAMPEP_0179119948 /NCGR_PEP_ID=MMETSP0796-20121207/56493_1 /TAXON_ID=73915 /ORGANISM="Pyrodinium bahamense, Strain pbaha01" /LENGTH=150 /DNA_ID=CAMNT_0020818475 /DNA_START=9 /DNA_END=461 /DNA_ORIENTATION=+